MQGQKRSEDKILLNIWKKKENPLIKYLSLEQTFPEIVHAIVLAPDSNIQEIKHLLFKISVSVLAFSLKQHSY